MEKSIWPRFGGGSSCDRDRPAMVLQFFSSRRLGRDHTVYGLSRYVPVLAPKPGALRSGGPFKD
jgi:hypothetical protein